MVSSGLLMKMLLTVWLKQQAQVSQSSRGTAGSEAKVLADILMSHFLVCRWLNHCSVLAWGRGEKTVRCPPSCYKGTNHIPEGSISQTSYL